MMLPGEERLEGRREPRTPPPEWPASTKHVIEVDEDTRIFRPPATENSQKFLDSSMRKLFGERLRWARVELCGMSTLDLFPLLGLEDQLTLMRLESGELNGALDISIVALAAQALGVPTDFLTGLTDLAEHLETHEAEFRRHLVSQWSVLMHRSTSAHGRRMARFAGLAQVVANSAELGAAAREVIERFSRMCELNVDQWEELRGGAPLLAAMDSLKDALRQAERHAAHTCRQLRADEVARADLEPLIEILGEMAVRFRGHA